MPAQELKFRLINILLLSVVLVSSGCFGGDGESDEGSELTIPKEEVIKKEILSYWERQEFVTVEECSRNCSDNRGEKKPKKVKILKTGNPQRGNPISNSEKEKKYWPVRVEVKGTCDKQESYGGRCIESEFSVKAEYNVYKNDFGEWEATFSN